MSWTLNDLEDRELGLIHLRSQAHAQRTGAWTFTDHQKLTEALQELEASRQALDRYASRLAVYRKAIEDVVEYLAKQRGADLEELMSTHTNERTVKDYGLQQRV